MLLPPGVLPHPPPPRLVPPAHGKYSSVSFLLFARDVPDIRFRFLLAGYPAVFFLSGSGSGSGQNGTRYRISLPDSAQSINSDFIA